MPARPQRVSDALAPLPRDRRYDLALSFAGEDREVARSIALVAQANGLRVFFDEHHLWEAWGRDLSEYLESVYGGGARYCVILVSEDYLQKPYTTLERRIALAHAMERAEEYVLPVVLDDSWLPGLPRTTAYLDIRTMSPIAVAEHLVRKVNGEQWNVARPVDWVAPGLVLLDDDVPAPAGEGMPGPVDVADVDVAAECKAWAEGRPYVDDAWAPGRPPRWEFRGGAGWYEDPILDITLVNRSGSVTLVSRIGIEAIGANYRAYEGLGGGGAEAVGLHRTYQLPLPDLWRTIAEGHRVALSPGADVHMRRGRAVPWVATTERSSTRLPDPVLVAPDRAYRFGLHLFDYVSFCPTEVEFVIWARTDKGEARSDPVGLSYFIGSNIPPDRRYFRLRDESPMPVFQDEEARDEEVRRIARGLWETGGRPSGRDLDFWFAAKRELSGGEVTADALAIAHKRTLL